MNNILISFLLLTLIFSACNRHHKHNGDHQHTHNNETQIELEPLAYTVYSETYELFVEFKPLVLGESSNFAAHFTQLGEQFKAVTEGSVTVRLIGLENQPPHTAISPSSPGIFRLALKPKYAGMYRLVFDIETSNFSDKITIDSVFVFPDTKSASEYSQANNLGDEIVYLKEQAWKIEFANIEVLKQSFTETIKTTGQILPAQGDEVIITAKSSGIVTFGSNKKRIGSEVNKNEILFVISGEGLIDDNLDAKYSLAKSNYEKAKRDFERATELVKDHIISQKEYSERQLKFENAETTFNNISGNYSSGGQQVKSPIKGHIKSILVSEGQYVETGQAIASISQNRTLILQAEVPQKHFSKLSSISSANFKTAYDDKVYSTDSLNGKLISYGKNTNNQAYYVPVNFEIVNKSGIIPGSFIEIFLKTNVITDALTIPHSALIEEHGNYYAYVQTSGEGFQKRALKLGGNDGINVLVLSGINENERVVTKGAYQIKLATMSGKMPAHGHDH